MNLKENFEKFEGEIQNRQDAYLFQENFKYTNLTSFFEEEFDLLRKGSQGVVFDDSIYQHGITRKFLPVTFAKKSDPSVLCLSSPLLSQSFQIGLNYFEYLNQTLSTEILEIEIEKEILLQKPLNLKLIAESSQCQISRIRLKLNERSSLRLFLMTSASDESALISTLNVELGKNSKLELIFLQDNSLMSYSFLNTKVALLEGSTLNCHSISLGSKLSRHNLDVFHLGQSSSSNLRGVYLSGQDQQMEHYTLIDHAVGNCNSNQHYKGILARDSRAVFNGKVLIHQGSEKASSEQLNNNLILHSSSEIDTKPQLEIYNDDVKATHGATVGQLNDEELFYLQSRGLPKQSALELLSLGFVTSVSSLIEDQIIRASIDAKMKEKLAVMNSAGMDKK